MKRPYLFLFLTMTVAQAQVGTDSLFMRIISPSNDTIRTGSPRIRIAASTLPTARAFINDAETKVYASGAFVGLYTPPRDTAVLRLRVVGPDGDSLSRQFVYLRLKPLGTSPHDTLVIEPAMMLPNDNLWLTAGDILEVRFKGSPGWTASFSIPGVESGLSMRELPPAEGSGLRGIYIGRYVVKPTDRTVGVPVEFKLKRSFFSREKAESKAKLWIMPDSLPRSAEIVGRRPFLNVGLGSDRLGGAKLGYVQPGALVQIAGKVGGQYKVRLSGQMEAWLPEEYAQLLPLDAPLPQSLAGSISATGTDSVDIVTVGLSRRLPYTSDQLTDPNAIVVDVYGATSNTNWITHHLSATGITSVKWNQVAADQYRLTIALKHRRHWGHDISYAGSSLRIRIRRPPNVRSPLRPLDSLVIAVDAGHGGDASGATGATGLREMDITLAIAKQIDSILSARGAQTVMTRLANEGPTMADRTDKVLTSGAQVLVSIHCNSGGEGSDPAGASGTSTYYRYIGFKPLADVAYEKMLELGLKQFGVVGSFNFSLNGPTQLPNVLVETAFISNPEDEMLLMDPDFRRRVAAKVADALEAYIRSSL